MKAADIASGTLYPLLDRLLGDQWLETRWEDSPLAGRPPRHLYRLTAHGRSEARRALKSLSQQRALKFGVSQT
jgi:DNA-binding PadR family transcriptional regulator